MSYTVGQVVYYTYTGSNGSVAEGVQQPYEISPLIVSKNIKVDFKNDELLKLKMNEELAGILINNLLANAVQHNNNNGKITIETSNTFLKLCNTGLNNDLTNNTIFNRFTKNNSQSLGLGSAIIKQNLLKHQMESSTKLK